MHLLVAGTDGGGTKIKGSFLAGIHATWWVDAQWPELDLFHIMDGDMIELVELLMTVLLAVFAHEFGDDFSEGWLALFELFICYYL